MEIQESRVRRLIAYDILNTPLNALQCRAYRQHRDLAREIGVMADEGADFGKGIVDVNYQNLQKSRVMREAVNEFARGEPRLGRELQRLIATKRTMRETHLTYGLPEDSRISSQDYIQVMEDIGVKSGQAERLYPQLLEVSYTIQKERGREKVHQGLRRVLIGNSEA